MINKKMTVATLLLMTGFSGFSSAHTVSGTLGTSTSAAAKTDVYTIVCFDDGAGAPAKIFVHVKDVGANIASAQVNTQATYLNPVTGAVTASVASLDAIEGDAAYSPGVAVTGGAGPYTLIVNKTLATVVGAETYTLEYHCQTSTGVHTGTPTTSPDFKSTQNQ